MMFETVLLENSDIQLIDGDRGKNYPKQADFSEDGFCLFLSAKNVTSSGFEFSERSYISSEKDELLRAGKLKRGDIVVTTRGTIGNVAYYGDDVPFDHIRINSGMMIFRADENRWNKRFLYFLLTSSFIRQQIDSLTSGSAVPQLPARDLKKFSLPNIPKNIQDRIERVVGDLTDKIKFNRQTNQTLEQIAQAIFKSWFVDFDPVKAKIETLAEGGSADDAELAAMSVISAKTLDELNSLKASNPEAFNKLAQTAALFPKDLDSETGTPAGWNSGVIADIAKLNANSWTKKNRPEQVHYVDLSNTKNGRIETVTTYGFDEAPSRARRILNSGDTIIGTVRPGNRAFAFIGETEKPLTGSTGFAVLSPKEEFWTSFVYLATTNDDAIDEYARLADGGAYPAIKPEVVADTPCVLPTKDIAQKFWQLTGAMLKKAHQARLENEELAKTRDTLLPKLLSGEINVTSEVVE
ncbi:restriction endonuclease subunit S [Vibrio vulnificus]|nr:restriction endonuclease subunit S [Vibrio vulnificus]ELK2280770.1 restriction endonuclease subunit S [Vibrio vulnificus]ELS0751093.1 restriction endonuclease subunit S [Vibrio vulnificus]